LQHLLNAADGARLLLNQLPLVAGQVAQLALPTRRNEAPGACWSLVAQPRSAGPRLSEPQGSTNRLRRQVAGSG
jgi:hypothetical protein